MGLKNVLSNNDWKYLLGKTHKFTGLKSSIDL